MTTSAAGDPNRLLAQAEAAFKAGQFDAAERDLAQVRAVAAGYPAPLHLSALVAKRQGRLDAAAAYFWQALNLAPEDPQILTNYGNLLGDRGQLTEAVASYDRALLASPDFRPAQINRAATLQRLERHEDALAQLSEMDVSGANSAQLFSMRGASLLALGRLQEAADVFDQALAMEAGRPNALIGRATVAKQRGEPCAITMLQQALAAQPGDRALLLQYAEALEANGDARAISVLEAAVRNSPDWPEGQRTLARMRWEAGDAAGFTRAIEERLGQVPGQAELWLALVDALASADLPARAAESARRGRRAVGDLPSLVAAEAMHSSEAGELGAADAAFALLEGSMPGVAVALARHRLRTGDWDGAQESIEREFEQDPWSVPAWALQGLIWPLNDDPRSDWLHGQPGLFAERELELDDQDITRIAECLRSLHRTRSHPLGQSLRGGTQTRGRLFARLEPEVLQLHDAIARALSAHWQALPPEDSAHPLLRHRSRRPVFAGSWSVRLTDGGFHVAHIHPRGVLSSACYLVVPDLSGEEGKLEIGGPPPELDLRLPPLTSFTPRPGRMILFPSTMFHGTCPFPKGERLTAAFDVVPE